MMNDSIWQPHTQQQIYRHLIDAMSRPGKMIDLQDNLSGKLAWEGILATLVDNATTFADPQNLLDPVFSGILGAKKATESTARYVFIDGGESPEFTPCLGDLPNPDRGATLVVKVKKLGQGQTMTLSGPGIVDQRQIAIDGFNSAWITRRKQWNADFPLGIDLILCDQERTVALPRTTRILEQ